MKQVWERLRSELVEIIEWSDATPGAPSPEGDTLAWRFAADGDPERSRSIRNGSQLIVREGQWAVFLDEGRIADTFGPGRHTLSTANLPLLTSLLCLPSGFESPFKAEVVFVCTRLFSDLRWGTRQPLLLRDPELGPVRLRGFGSCSLRVSDPAWLVRELSGASGRLSLEALRDPLRSLIVSRLADVLGRCGCPVFDLSSRYEILARDLRLALLEDAQQFGLEIPSLLIEALTLPPEVEAALVRRTVRRVEGEPEEVVLASSSSHGTASIPAPPRPEACGLIFPASTAAAVDPGPASPGSAPPPARPGAGEPPPAAGASPGRVGDRPEAARPRRAPPPPPPPPGLRLTRPSPEAEITEISLPAAMPPDAPQPWMRSTSAAPVPTADAPSITGAASPAPDAVP